MGGLGKVFLRNNFTDEHRSADTAWHPSYGWSTTWARTPMFDICIMPLVTTCLVPKLIHLTSFSRALNFYTEFKVSHPPPKTQEKTLHMDITIWSMPKSDWLYSFQPKMRSSVQSAKTKPGADCGSDYELLIAKFRLKLKKVEKTPRPFRYDLNHILYDCTV